jgi:MoaA/NifB/PqqE/SkfB family radical SAM enzyme
MTAVAPAPLVDSFGRVADSLRISVTDRCNLRCRYCMPAAGLAWLPREELLTDPEVERLARLLGPQPSSLREKWFGEPTASCRAPNRPAGTAAARSVPTAA